MSRILSTLLPIISIILSAWAVVKVNKSTPHSHGLVSDAIDMNDPVALVESALNKKPEMIVEAMTNLQKKAQQRKKEEATENVKLHKDRVFNHAGDPIGGNPNGDVTLVYFFDYRCGYCRRGHGVVHEAVKTDGNTKIIYKEFPALGGNPIMAMAALAAEMQGKYQDLHNAFMSSSGNLKMDEILELAEKNGLDVERLKKDMKSKNVERELKENLELAQAIGVDGTPTYIINDEVIAGMVGVDDFDQKIKEARAKIAEKKQTGDSENKSETPSDESSDDKSNAPDAPTADEKKDDTASSSEAEQKS